MHVSPLGKVGLATLAAGLACAGFFLSRSALVSATPAPEAAPEAVPTAPASDMAQLDASVSPVDTSSTTATITFMTVPFTTSTVFWGKKILGKITPGKPLVVVRPRDSGPLDVVVRANGYLAVQTRAHTFSDSKVMVKLTRPDKKNELLGYRIPIEAGLPEGGLDGGVLDAGLLNDGGRLPVFPPPPASPVPPPAQPAPSFF